MKELTDRQQEILDFIQEYFGQTRVWPSIREIQSQFGFKSTNAVMGHLRALEKKGFIARIPGQARAFRVTYEPPNTLPDTENLVDIPVYGTIPAGYPDGVESSGAISRMQIDVASAGIRRSKKAFALKVRGESMVNAGIFDGDLVIVEEGTPQNGNIVAALIDGETTLKRYIHKGRKSPFLQAENPDYPDLYPTSELLVQGIAKAVVRNL